MEELIIRVREEYQIPPYFSDEGIKSYAIEGETRLKSLNPIADTKNDETYKMLLKTYIYYAYHHKIDEWEKNYENLIVSWQLGTEVR
ncbi:hypothetical protein [Faecalimonas sp.]